MRRGPSDLQSLLMTLSHEVSPTACHHRSDWDAGCGDVTRGCCSWLSKMQVAKRVLVDNAGKHPDLDALSNAFIYLQVSLSSASRSTR